MRSMTGLLMDGVPVWDLWMGRAALRRYPTGVFTIDEGLRRGLQAVQYRCHLVAYPGGIMELRHLRYFREVAGTLNFTRAAELLHL
ncbi:hypothetical protein M2C68_19140, partial [Pseudomonas sp. BAgro211]|nr:hypothetical protein [Pseudomonas sp. BAgro211]